MRKLKLSEITSTYMVWGLLNRMAEIYTKLTSIHRPLLSLSHHAAPSSYWKITFEMKVTEVILDLKVAIPRHRSINKLTLHIYISFMYPFSSHDFLFSITSWVSDTVIPIQRWKTKDITIVILIIKAIWKENVQVGRNTANMRRNYKLVGTRKGLVNLSDLCGKILEFINAIPLNTYCPKFKKSSRGKR